MKAYKKSLAESPVASLRKRLGLSQEQMADQLKLSCSMIKMVESGKRAMSTPVLLQVAQLEIKLAAQPHLQSRDIHPAENNATDKYKRSCEMLFSHEAASRLKARKLQAKLQTITALYQKTREWLQLIESHKEENGHNPMTLAWWKKQEESAIQTLQNCGMPTQVLMRHKIALLESEAALYKNKHTEIKADLPQFFKSTAESS